MADDKENPASATAMPRVRRRAPTIELKATEVAIEPPPETPESSTPPESDRTVPPDYPTEPPAYETGSDEPPSEPPPSPEPHSRAGSSFFAGPIMAATIAGGLTALIIVIVMALAGLFSGGGAPSDPRLAQIETQLREIANRPGPRAPDARPLDELNARLARLEAALSSRADNQATASGNSDEAIKALQASVADLARRADDNASATREARGQADAALVAADAARVAAEKSNVDALNSRIAALESATKKLSEDVAKSLTAAGGDKALRAVVAAQALRDAVERGGPFASELAAVKATAANPSALAPLESFASGGLPGATALARQMSDLAPAMLKLASPPPPSGGFLDRLSANAEKLVRIRPIDEQPGDDPGSVISRAQAKAARADLSGAVSELKALPSQMRAPAEDWIKKAEAREAAVKASARLVSEALAGLGKATP